MIFKLVKAKNLFRFGSKVLGNIGKPGLELKKRHLHAVRELDFQIRGK